MRFVLLICVMLGVLSGCRKKTSPEFYKLEGEQSILIARTGDDAYVSDEMTAIVASLSAIPLDTVEKARADALVATLAAQKARVLAERVEQPKPPQVDPFAGRFPPPALPVEPLPEAPPAPDAGPPEEPWTGMDEATFKQLFGRCFSKGPPTTAARGVPATTQVLGPSTECQKKLGTPGSVTSYVFVDGGVFGKMLETVTVMDAGSPSPPPPPLVVTPDAGERVLTIPGAPLPEGYERSTGN